jgi:Zn-dependent peptidase ImmA (M78 family)
MHADEQATKLHTEYATVYSARGLPVPVDRIAEDLLGLAVQEVEALDVSGMLIPADRAILVNAGEARRSPARRRFTIAHEIGHWVCHSQGAKPAERFCRDVGVAEGAGIEREANAFAAELLMPAEHVIEEADRLRMNVLALATLFEVSRPAMQFRLINLGVLPEYMR